MKNYILGFLLFISSVSFSQTISVVYSEKNIVSEESLKAMPSVLRKIKSKAYDYDFKYSNGISMYKNAINTKNIDTLTLPNSDENQTFKQQGRFTYDFLEKFYYKDINQNKLLFHFFDGNNYNDGDDNLLNFNWQILDEKQTICGYECQKATALIYGYNFTAWFTNAIPIKSGPEKFDGLPGLILKVETKNFVNQATKISFLKDDTSFEVPKFHGKTYTIKEIDDSFKDKMRELERKGNTLLIKN